ncbi:LysM domain-containing protein [Austwickia chelonae]|uniref:LysM domain-containing protein n=1 Tax=Austwickia chelonae NBRC 105200 TaxID=1184607 RepID=K6W6W1_9MICO|nr:LysM peptidoglycan-binding domain-containing protein [Austwickia chelonae]GAB77562.1 hypothetical protein AUCHE_05_04750 [Austwickia chelonae NBRC 105200]SEW12958.1 LysM domain-containing protein [Austwickia chelonae]
MNERDGSIWGSATDDVPAARTDSSTDYFSPVDEIPIEDSDEEDNMEQPGEDIGDAISAEQYVVSEGDTLWDIAERYYGDGSQYLRIAESNQIANPDMIYVGQVLAIPV